MIPLIGHFMVNGSDGRQYHHLSWEAHESQAVLT